MASQKPTLAQIKDLLDDEFPTGYNAHIDPLADAYDRATTINRLGAALRAAVEMLEAPRP